MNVDECTICVSELEDREKVRTLRCGHTFHVGCIDKWIVVNLKCPNCRENVAHNP